MLGIFGLLLDSPSEEGTIDLKAEGIRVIRVVGRAGMVRGWETVFLVRAALPIHAQVYRSFPNLF